MRTEYMTYSTKHMNAMINDEAYTAKFTDDSFKIAIENKITAFGVHYAISKSDGDGLVIDVNSDRVNNDVLITIMMVTSKLTAVVKTPSDTYIAAYGKGETAPKTSKFKTAMKVVTVVGVIAGIGFGLNALRS